MSRKVAHNVLWNVTGTLASLAVGLIALPVLLHAMGAARLGIFTLALGLIGFSGLLDLGLGRALTQTVSSALGSGRPQAAVAALVWHVLGLLAGLGSAAFAWELATKHRLGKLGLPGLTLQRYESLLAADGFAPLAITTGHTLLAGSYT